MTRLTAFYVGYPLGKGVLIGGTVTAVIHTSGLSSFAQALIIAMVSATIGAIGMIGAAHISRQEARRLEGQARENTQHLVDIKKAQGIDRRTEDTEPDEDVTT